MANTPKTCCCVLCGCVCGGGGADENWKNQFYAVYDLVEEQPGRAYLSGPVRFRGSRYEIQAAPGTGESETIGIDLMPSENPYRNENPAQGFPFHKACWELFTECWSPSDRELQLLLGVCRSVPTQGRSRWQSTLILNWGHDYGGLWRIVTEREKLSYGEDCCIRFGNFTGLYHASHSDPAAPQSELIELLNELLPDGDTTVCSRPSSEEGDAEEEGPITITITITGANDVFRQLPVEIRQQIMENLTLSDVLALRQVSRVFAELGFHDLFWKSRFYPGGELGHMAEVRQFVSLFPGHWRLVWVLADFFADSPCFQNRARIMALASSLRNLVLKAGSAECAGSDISAAPEEPEVTWQCASRWRPEPYLHQRYLPDPSKITAVFASAVDVCGRRCVAGIRFQQNDEKGGSQSLTFGYRHPADEVLLLNNELHPFGIAGFCLAVTNHTIRGLAVITDTGTVSGWVGDHENLQKRKLIATSSGMDAITGLRGAFDALKLVSLSVTSGIPGQEQPQDEPLPKDSIVWHSDLPAFHHKAPGLRYPDDYSYPSYNQNIPISMMLFGGAHGEDLPFVTRIIVQQGSKDQGLKPQLWAIKIRFSDGREPLTFGPKISKPLSVSFPIDGPGGERITAMKQVGNTVDLRFGFRMRTNRGRSIMFPFGLRNVHTYDEKPKALEKMNETVVGIWGKVSPMYGISAIGPLCLQRDDSDGESLDSPDNDYDEESLDSQDNESDGESLDSQDFDFEGESFDSQDDDSDRESLDSQDSHEG